MEAVRNGLTWDELSEETQRELTEVIGMHRTEELNLGYELGHPFEIWSERNEKGNIITVSYYDKNKGTTCHYHYQKQADGWHCWNTIVAWLLIPPKKK